MKVILKEDISNLGEIGSIVNVADGYARNYLIPKKIVVEANDRNIKASEHEKRIIQNKIKKLKSGGEEMATKISSISLSIKAKAGEEGKLFGSITSLDISKALAEEGFDIDKRKIILDNPIKRIGDYTIKVRIHPEVTANLSVQVAS